MDERDQARLLAAVRTAIGIAFVLAPRRAGRVWTGGDASTVTAKLAARSLGARDLALGVGTLRALDGSAPARGWLEAGAIADASDALGIVTSWGRLPPARRLLFLASASGAAYLGFKLAGTLD